MDPLNDLSEADRWTSAVLDEVFKAFVSSTALSQMLVYKGARVLRFRLQETLRASFDIDANLSSFAANADGVPDGPNLESIRDLTHRAVSGYFERQEPVRYVLERSMITNRRKSGAHPRGWDVYWLFLHVRDLAAESTVSSFEGQLRMDIASPELLSDNSVSPLVVDGHTINAATLERIAGEKLRAFLTHLPTYRKKLGETTDLERRVKDLYDLVRIIRKRPLSDAVFWTIAGEEFRLACQSRCVDCEGTASFREEWDETEKSYAADKTLPGDVTFKEVEATVDEITSFLATKGFVPFRIELPNAG
jgi:hypothetical protein